ncbi:hypothetical protein ACGFZB_28935 [Streptomyces cinerochromogenes]|uniref:Uncharacterized protein n=1 Tax=Streptomyces cinerochromogenes TaxID=66422 RepID=A0ABW7BFA6_9ACTN
MTKLDDDTLITLERLEHVQDESPTRVHRRSASLLTYLVAAGYVEAFGPAGEGRIRITETGRRALEEHRRAQR